MILCPTVATLQLVCSCIILMAKFHINTIMSVSKTYMSTTIAQIGYFDFFLVDVSLLFIPFAAKNLPQPSKFKCYQKMNANQQAAHV